MIDYLLTISANRLVAGWLVSMLALLVLAVALGAAEAFTGEILLGLLAGVALLATAIPTALLVAVARKDQ